MTSPSETHYPNNRNCCFCIPHRWRKVPTSESDEDPPTRGLWTRGITVLKKIREWSEIVAGPRWKTFIRRFNRNKTSKFQYDPISYALNFDMGPLENGDPESENEYMVRNFSSRYVLPPAAVVQGSGSGNGKPDGCRNDIGPGFV
ncbi:uncharacterized protein LOC143565120 [Bidens hawaiensis]|uniref:uncharacterized protein LOC143565120 n=1 Tax=Bidens hawaiensis TaxID=980011 RepID=UPI00404B66DD